MVAGKVIKAAMGGFQKERKSPSSTPRHHKSSSPTSISHDNTKSSSSSGFSRYFPRTTSSQVQPRVSKTTTGGGSSTISDLLRLVEELQEKESRLKTELLEHKILKETASIVPILEEEIARKNEELERERWKVDALEEENEEMRMELEKLRSIVLFEEESREVERRIEDVESEIEELKKAVTLRRNSKCFAYDIVDDDDDDDRCSSSKRCGVVVVVDKKSRSDLQKTKKRIEAKSDVSKLPTTSSPEMVVESISQGETEVTTVEVSESLVVSAIESRNPRVPRPPPAPTSSSSSSSSSSVSSSETPTGECGSSKLLPPPPPPPPAPLRAVPSSSSQPTGGPRPPGPPPPPPPPPPSKGGKPPAAKVRRVPEVVEFYHSLMRRDSKRESGSSLTDTSAPTSATSASSAASAKDMIGEIENRSAYLLAIKTEVETQGDFIRFLIKEVNNAAFTNIEDVVAFVKWLDDELSFLVDERAVLKHFEWPEKKADAMREAAFGYSDLKKLESEAAALRDDCHQNCSASMKKMQALLEKLEHGVYNLSRVREAAMRRYKGFRIPWEWMLDTGLMSQIKLASVKLAMKYMKRVSAELEAVDGVQEEEDLVLQGVRFAFRVHQFAGGFDVETMKAFQELRDKSSSCQVQSQNQNHNRHNQNQKLVCCKSTTDC